MQPSGSPEGTPTQRSERSPVESRPDVPAMDAGSGSPEGVPAAESGPDVTVSESFEGTPTRECGSSERELEATGSRPDVDSAAAAAAAESRSDVHADEVASGSPEGTPTRLCEPAARTALDDGASSSGESRAAGESRSDVVASGSAEGTREDGCWGREDADECRAPGVATEHSLKHSPEHSERSIEHSIEHSIERRVLGAAAGHSLEHSLEHSPDCSPEHSIEHSVEHSIEHRAPGAATERCVDASQADTSDGFLDGTLGEASRVLDFGGGASRMGDEAAAMAPTPRCDLLFPFSFSIGGWNSFVL